MPLRSCAVTFTDPRGVKHTVEVVAESLFEAAVLGVQVLRKDGWIEGMLGATTKIDVEVREPVTRHTVTMQQIERAEHCRRRLLVSRGRQSTSGHAAGRERVGAVETAGRPHACGGFRIVGHCAALC